MVTYGEGATDGKVTNTYKWKEQSDTPQTYDVPITKVVEAAEGCALPDTWSFNFTLEGGDYSRTIELSKDNANGSFENVPAGEYILTEVIPEGEAGKWVDPVEKTITVEADGAITCDGKGINSEKSLIITNTYKYKESGDSEPEEPGKPGGGTPGGPGNPGGTDPSGGGTTPIPDPVDPPAVDDGDAGDADDTADSDPMGDNDVINDGNDVTPAGETDALEDDSESKGVQTGDVTDMYLWLALLAVSAAGAGTLAVSARRRKEN